MDNTPILVGVGQFTERVGDAGYQGLSPVELAVQAARQALRDCGVSELAVDVVATTRTFEDSLPQPAPFGKTDNFPRALARHLGSAPAQAYWEQMGGNTPQQLVNHFAERLARGQGTLVLLAGAEAISTVRHLLATGQRRDWNERLREPVDDQGSGWNRLLTAELAAHRLANIPAAYALLENARRARLQLDRSDYALQMGELFAPLTHVAAANPYSATRQTGATAHQLTTVTEHNRLIAEPYPLHLVARDQVNQAAALVLTTVAKARALRIDPRKWLYLNGYADLVERDVLDRPDLGAYPAGVAASKAALRAAHVTTEHVQFWDFYSCFPIAVSSVAQDGLGLAADNPRGLTVTGGLPYFGGPGNNYSMHAIATMAEKLRSAPGTFGFVGANGGFLSKYSVGVYTTTPKRWQAHNSASLQQELDAVPAPPRESAPNGSATIETATVVFAKGQPDYAVAVGRMHSNQGRFVAIASDSATVSQLLAADPLGRTISVQAQASQNHFRLG